MTGRLSEGPALEVGGAVAAAPPPAAYRRWLEVALSSGLALVLIYALMLVVFGLTADGFFTTDNLITIAEGVATLGIVAAVQTVVIISGGFDLSVGSTAALTSVVAAKVLIGGGGPVAAVAGALAVGTAVGILNGLVITRLRVNPLIATLATFSAIRGVAFVWTDALTQLYPTKYLAYMGRQRILDNNLPLSIIYMLATFLVVWLVLRYTVFGRFVYAVGGNPRAAFLAGLHVDRVRVIVYAASGLSAGLAGLVIASQLIAGSPQAANQLELNAVTAAVLGGASLSGGQGRVWMTLIGALIMGTLTNGLVLLNISSFWQMIALGVVLVLAVALDQVRIRTRG